VRGTIIRVQVERVPARTRPPKVLWLWWAGSGEPDLDLAWRAYIRRFDLAAWVDHPASAPSPTGGAVDLAGSCGLYPVATGPRGGRRAAVAVGAAPTPAAAVALSGAARVSAPAVRVGHTGRRAETCRALPRTTQGRLLGTRDPLPGDQEALQQAQEEAEQDRKGRLIGHH
jgi:hypothetical protein